MNKYRYLLTLSALMLLCASCAKPYGRTVGGTPESGSGAGSGGGSTSESGVFDVKTIGSHSISGSSVILEGTFIGTNASMVSMGFYYQKKSSLSAERVLAGELDEKNSFFATVTNLEVGEEYAYWAFAGNDEDEKWGRVLSFSTASDIGGDGERGPVATSFASGDGSAENPYIISDASHLRFLSDECARGKTFRGDHLLVIKDIVFNSNLIVSGHLNPSGEKEIWYPINGFQGTFDGGNHIISGLYADSSELQKLSSEVTNRIGLFGLSAGLIKNVRVEDSYFSSLSGFTIGGIIGEHSAGQGNTAENNIINCHFSGIIDGGFRYKTGGIVGANYVGKVINCSFSGIITGAMGGGSGIVGSVGFGGTIINCINYGRISGYYCCGILGQGIRGRVTISNCINAGEIKYNNPVSASEGHIYLVGIFIGGSNATLNNNINYGTISGPDERVGAIFGTTYDEHTINGQGYYLETSAKKWAVQLPSRTQATSMTEKEMKDPAFLSALNKAAKSLDGACSWKFDKDGFPTLDWAE